MRDTQQIVIAELMVGGFLERDVKWITGCERTIIQEK